MNSFCPEEDWKRDSNNYVAKRYTDDCKKDNYTQGNTNVPRETYFEDIKLQMEAKLWGERGLPKKFLDFLETEN